MKITLSEQRVDYKQTELNERKMKSLIALTL
jgi:hypothetical protein